MIRSIRKTVKLLLRLSELLGKGLIGLGCVFIATLVILVFYSSVRRYAVGTPLAATDELAALLFLAGSILTVTYGFFDNRLIRIELIWARLSGRIKLAADIAGQLVAVVVFAIVVKATFGFALGYIEYGSKTTISNIPLWPWAMAIPVSMGLMAWSMFLNAVDGIFDLICGAE